jgi:hypothetical protein
MVGKVAVQVVIVNGSTPDLRFTAGDDLAVRAMANKALSLLGAHATANIPRIQLQFGLHIRSVQVSTPNSFARLRDIGTDFEARETPWRDAALAVLGHPAGTQGCLALAAAGKGGADHSLVCFLTKYNLAWQAYAGPERATAVIDWPWLSDTTRRGAGLPVADRVLAHEIGHVFHAPDEGAMKGSTPGSLVGCTVLTPDGKGFGALDFPNFNCMVTNPSSSQSCLMRFGATEASFICSSTRAHWGWVDSDGDGRLDVFP